MKLKWVLYFSCWCCVSRPKKGRAFTPLSLKRASSPGNNVTLSLLHTCVCRISNRCWSRLVTPSTTLCRAAWVSLCFSLSPRRNKAVDFCSTSQLQASSPTSRPQSLSPLQSSIVSSPGHVSRPGSTLLRSCWYQCIADTWPWNVKSFSGSHQHRKSP